MEPASLVPLWVQIVMTLGGIGAGFLAMRQEGKKQAAGREKELDDRFNALIDAQEIVRKSMAAEIESMQKARETERKMFQAEIDALRAELGELRARLRIYQMGVDKLISQLTKAGLKPAWIPPNGHEEHDVPQDSESAS